MPKDAAVAAQLARFERAEWQYDGLGGMVIQWTRQHGGRSEDPDVQAFVVIPDTEKVERAPDTQVHATSGFAKWLQEKADAWERAHPVLKVPLRKATLSARDRKGDQVVFGCAEVEAAQAAGRPALVYVGRGDRNDLDRKLRPEAQASRSVEKALFASELVAKAAEGWALVRLDLNDEDDASYARTLGVEKAPAVLLVVAGEPKPQVLDAQTDAAALAFRLRKHAPTK